MRSRGPFASFDPRRLATAAVVAVVALVISVSVWQLVKPKDLRITASLPRAVGLYQGDAVRVLGLKVGTIESVKNDGGAVQVTMKVDHGVPVPAGAQAVVVAPSLVSGRYVQLAPVYRSGPKMQQDAVIPKSRTQVPVEFDELKSALNRFGQDLGPDGKADGRGPLGRAIETGSKNLAGNGQTMNDTLKELSSAITTLSESRGDIFATVRNLAEFTQMLAETDTRMRSFTTQMSGLTGQLADSREELGQTLDRLDTLLPQVTTFVRENRPLLRNSTGQLDQLVTLLERNRQNLADGLQVAPTALSNVYNIYDPKRRDSVGSLVLPYKTTPAGVVCGMLSLAGAADRCDQLSGPLKLLDQAAGPAKPVTGGIGALLGAGTRS